MRNETKCQDCFTWLSLKDGFYYVIHLIQSMLQVNELQKEFDILLTQQYCQADFFIIFFITQAAKVSRVDRDIPKSSSSYPQVILKSSSSHPQVILKFEQV